MATLDVFCFGERAGVLSDAEDGLRFAYDEAWVEGGHPPLSHSLPLTGSLAVPVVRAFFSGLLPEAEPRRLLARRVGVSERNDFALLAAIGGDCPGAISLAASGSGPPPDAHGVDVDWLDDAELSELIATLPDRPMLADGDGEIRLSLAGAQDKLPVVLDAHGRVGITSGRTPSTHILKTPIARFEGTVVNEAFCLALGRRLGVAAVRAQPRRAGERECLLVERYDRRLLVDGSVERLHQEDFCQALGIAPERKYEVEGGPSLADCFALVRDATTVPAAHALVLLDGVGLSFLVGNHDAHGKNLSLLCAPERIALAPFYDVLSTAVYSGLSRKTAMALGGERRPEHVRRRHLDRMLAGARLGAAPARRRLAAMAREAPSAARAVRAELAAEGWDHPLLDRVLAIVDRRTRLLADVLGGPRAPAL
jgi:serine/threonine-protein kinase HipA